MVSRTIDDRWVRLRREVFGDHYELDPLLLEVGREVATHAFLSNPAGQYPYLYLTRYVMRFVEEWFDAPVGKLSILDWGSGKGHVSHLLRRLGARVTSADLLRPKQDSSFGQEVPIVARTGLEIAPLDHAWRLPFEDGRFDAVLSFGVLEHVSDDAASVAQLHRVLKPGGLFFCFNLPYFLSWTQRLAHLRGNRYHDRLYRNGGVSRLLERNGFEVVDSWHRQLLPKNSVRYPAFRLVEAVDQLLTEHTPLRRLATNIELVATKR